jgi:hypothetical protein
VSFAGVDDKQQVKTGFYGFLRQSKGEVAAAVRPGLEKCLTVFGIKNSNLNILWLFVAAKSGFSMDNVAFGPGKYAYFMAVRRTGDETG